MSIAKAATALRAFLIGDRPAAPGVRATGVAVRACLRPGAAEIVIRFDDGSYQILSLTLERGITMARDLLDIAVQGASRR